MKLSEAADILKEAGIEDGKREARLLFSHFSGLPDALLYGANAESFSEELAEAVNRRAKREPLQYIIGKVDFYKETYMVSSDCLIPRSDTEILVDEVIKRIPSGAKIIDLCTGSGCIALSVLRNTVLTTAVALDISAAALSVARQNADSLSLGSRVEFISADVLEKAIEGKFFAVISNPPYVTEGAYQNLAPEIYFEPRIAFLGGEDGLVFYRRIVSLYKNSLCEGGFFAFEIGYDQADSIRQIAKDNSFLCEIIKDYSGNNRVAVLKK